MTAFARDDRAFPRRVFVRANIRGRRPVNIGNELRLSAEFRENRRRDRIYVTHRAFGRDCTSCPPPPTSLSLSPRFACFASFSVSLALSLQRVRQERSVAASGHHLADHSPHVELTEKSEKTTRPSPLPDRALLSFHGDIVDCCP